MNVATRRMFIRLVLWEELNVEKCVCDQDLPLMLKGAE